MNKICALFLVGLAALAAGPQVSVCAADAPVDVAANAPASSVTPASFVTPAKDDPWQVVETNSRGIVVRKRRGTSGALSAFQGEGVIRGNVLHVLAVILDAAEVEHWAYGITDASRVTGRGDSHELLYLYSDTPWPVRDRDMVVRREVEVLKAAEAFRIHLRCAPDELPEREGVVRVRDCESTFTLQRSSEDSTRVTYETHLDPAGSVPSWASHWVAKTAPIRTLEALETCASRKDGRYAAFVKRWSKAL